MSKEPSDRASDRGDAARGPQGQEQPPGSPAGDGSYGPWPFVLAGLLGVVVAGPLLLGLQSRGDFRMLLREDGWGEWATFLAFLVAAGRAIQGGFKYSESRLDRLVLFGLALCCLFVAGEEISWGQRLLGFVPPEAFLKHNVQQEFEIHNLLRHVILSQHLVQAAAIAYALASLLALTRWFPQALGPHVSLVPWLLVVAGLEYTYNFSDYLPRTGDFAEMLLGLVLLADVSMRRRGRARLSGCRTAILAVAGVLVSAALVVPLTEGVFSRSDPKRIAATRAELILLRGDVNKEGVLNPYTFRKRFVHKRIFSAVRRGYVRFGDRSEFLEHQRNPVESPPGDGRTDRRGYFIDLWGQPYWFLYRREAPDRAWLLLYSFGPNRRRDFSARDVSLGSGGPGGFQAGDDIGVLIEFKVERGERPGR